MRRRPPRSNSSSSGGGSRSSSSSIGKKIGPVAAAGVAVLVALIVLPTFGVESPIEPRTALFILAGLVLVTGTGAIDDVINLRARTKFLFQVGAALLIAIGGIQIDSITLPYLGKVHFGVLAVPITVLWIVGLLCRCARCCVMASELKCTIGLQLETCLSYH